MQLFFQFVSENLIWFLGLGVVSYLLSQDNQSRNARFAIDAKEFALKIQQGFTVYDIRAASVFEQSHIEGAKHITLAKVQEKIMRAAEKKKTLKMLIVSETGNELNELFKKPEMLNTGAFILSGGFKSWLDEGFLIQEATS
ncbi:MAG: rhodanese-like domain-containing protein [Candidatus Comchoanobacterales bacterium]